MNEAQLASAAYQFLQRAQLHGGEVPTFVAVLQWLMDKQAAAQQPAPLPPGEEVAPPRGLRAIGGDESSG